MLKQNPSSGAMRLRSPVLAGFLLGVAICLLVAVLTQSGALTGSELQGYDLLTAWGGPGSPSAQIVVVDFDDATVRAYNAFPIPRALLAQVVDKISAGEPAVIGLDIILDRKRSDVEDLRLAQAVGHAGNVILVSEYGFEQQLRADPLPAFQNAAAGVAFGDLPIDEDGAVRRMFLHILKPDYKALSYPVAMADYFSDQHLRPGGKGFVLFGSTPIPLVRSTPDSVLIRFHPSFPAQIVSVQQLLAPNFDSRALKGKIVLVGQSSEFGKDLFATPAFRFRVPNQGRSSLSGTEIHAAAIQTLLNGTAVRRLGTPLQWGLALVVVTALVIVGIRLRWPAAMAVVLVTMVALLAVASWLFSHRQLWIPIVSSELCLALVIPGALGYRFLEERRLKGLMQAERQHLMSLFERYVSPEVAAEIWDRRDEVVLVGEERMGTVLFSDIRNFTALTAGKPSAEVLAWLNRYLTAMSEVVKANAGFLNKFIGDGIMVIFGVPLSEGAGKDACNAVRCALQMLERVDQLNLGLEKGQPHLKIGVGIHTGMLTAGNVGSPDRLEYSVIGETVNLASRLESMTKEFKTSIVISPATWENVRKQFPTVPLGEAQVRGFSEKIMLYSVATKDAVAKDIEVQPR